MSGAVAAVVLDVGANVTVPDAGDGFDRSIASLVSRQRMMAPLNAAAFVTCISTSSGRLHIYLLHLLDNGELEDLGASERYDLRRLAT
jgi:hypothetical protein